MNRQRIAQVTTIAVLAAILGMAVARKSLWRGVADASREAEPQDTVYAMLNAARAGDVRSYLGAFTPGMQASLRQSIAESSDAGFANYLRDSNRALKGSAVSGQVIDGNQARVRVEYVYQDRNEAQIMTLEKQQGGWKIAAAESEERVKTLIPYGTPVRRIR